MVGDGVATSVVDAVDPMSDAPAERKRMAYILLTASFRDWHSRRNGRTRMRRD